MNDREVAGVRRAITWLHKRAGEMNDPHARAILNTAAFNLGVDLGEWRGSKPTEASFRENFSRLRGEIFAHLERLAAAGDKDIKP